MDSQASAEPHLIRERLGKTIGWLAAPVVAAIAALRHSRMFHPDGIVFRATVVPINEDSLLARLAEKLEGPALVRMSAALWKGDEERPDALGLAIRFGDADEANLESGDQDLLFATILSPLTMPFSPFTTDVHDFLDNQYFAVAPFDVGGIGRVKLRLVPEHTADGAEKNSEAEKDVDSPAAETAPTRRELLERQVKEGSATLRLELRHTWHRDWQPVARVTLEEKLTVDQAALRFDPFRNGRGIVPKGFVHFLRRGAYAASQAARP